MSRTRISATGLFKVFVFIFVLVIVVSHAPAPSQWFSRQKRIDQASELVCSQILLTRQKAVASHTRYRIHYDYASGACTTYREISPDEWRPEKLDEGRMPQGVSFSPTSTPSHGTIDIGENGTVEGLSAPLMIRLVDGEGKQKGIRISPAGMVQEIPTR